MIYKCPKPESRNCEKCLFEGICYDSDECRNTISRLPVFEVDVVHFMEGDECRNTISTLPVLEADVVHFMEED